MDSLLDVSTLNWDRLPQDVSSSKSVSVDIIIGDNLWTSIPISVLSDKANIA